jgi:hypothetical protein
MSTLRNLFRDGAGFDLVRIVAGHYALTRAVKNEYFTQIARRVICDHSGRAEGPAEMPGFLRLSLDSY